VTVFSRLLADRRRGACWWALGMVVGVASVVGLWPTVKGNVDIQQLMDDLPAGVRALIGSQADIPLSSAPGYLQARLFSTVLPVLLLVYAIGLGARVIGGAEEDGTLLLVVAAPVTRRRVAAERLAASMVLVLGLAVTGVATAAGLGALVGIFEEVTPGRMVVASAAVLAHTLLHLSIAFSVGAVTGRRGPAVSVASVVAVGGYLVHALAASASAVEPVRALSPWWWLLDRNLLVQPPTFLALGLPLILAAVLAVVGVVRFERRDLRFP